MTDIFEVAAELEASRSQHYHGFQDLCTLSHSKSGRYRSCNWSSYFLEDCSADDPPEDSSFRKSAVDNAPEKVCFTRKNSLDLVTLVDAEKGSDENCDGEHSHGVRWDEVSRKMSRRGIKFSARDCYIQYCNVDSKGINRGVWGADEDRRLLALTISSEVSNNLSTSMFAHIFSAVGR